MVTCLLSYCHLWGVFSPILNTLRHLCIGGGLMSENNFLHTHAII